MFERGIIVVAHPWADFRRRLVGALRERGHSVIECRDGLELVRLVQQHLPGGCDRLAALVADVALPGYRPIEVMACARWLGASIPTVLTGVESAPISERARRAGVRAGMAPDAHVDEVVAAVEEALASRSSWSPEWADEPTTERDARL
jgi:CheY-like chemotaxis protein